MKTFIKNFVLGLVINEVKQLVVKEVEEKLPKVVARVEEDKVKNAVLAEVAKQINGAIEKKKIDGVFTLGK